MELAQQKKSGGSTARMIAGSLVAASLLASGNALAWTATEAPGSPSVMSLGTLTGNTLSFTGEAGVISNKLEVNDLDPDSYTDSMTINILAGAGELLSSITLNETAFINFGSGANYAFSALATATLANGGSVTLGNFEWDSESTGGSPNYTFASGTLNLVPGVTALTIYLENTLSYSNFDGNNTGAFIRLDEVNLTVATTPVPLPAAAWLFAPAALLLARRRNAQA